MNIELSSKSVSAAERVRMALTEITANAERRQPLFNCIVRNRIPHFFVEFELVLQKMYRQNKYLPVK
jgi:hypothetical protein